MNQLLLILNEFTISSWAPNLFVNNTSWQPSIVSIKKGIDPPAKFLVNGKRTSFLYNSMFIIVINLIAIVVLIVLI